MAATGQLDSTLVDAVITLAAAIDDQMDNVPADASMRVSTLNDGPFSTVSDGAWLVGVEPGIGGRGAVNHSPPRGEKG